jgi:hypothetical protein
MAELLQKFLNADFDTPGQKALDWILSFISIAIAFWPGGDWLWIGCWLGGGILGCIASWLRPWTQLQKFLLGIIKRKIGQGQ